MTVEPCLQFTQTQVFSFPNSDFQEFTHPDSGTCCFHRFIFTIQFLIPRNFFYIFHFVISCNTWQLNSVWLPEQTFPFLNSFPAKSQHHITFLISETIFVCLFFSSVLFQNHLMWLIFKYIQAISNFCVYNFFFKKKDEIFGTRRAISETTTKKSAIYLWGYNESGQTGRKGEQWQLRIPRQLPPQLFGCPAATGHNSRWFDIACGREHTAVVNFG